MASPLVETKLFCPRPRADAVARPRLLELLEPTRSTRLVLVSAPPGFGKTTLLATWLNAPSNQRRSVAWLSLEEADHEPARFWTYLVTAVQRAVPQIGEGALALLQTRQPSFEAVLATLINELSTLPTGLDVVLDDYHLVDNPDLGPGVGYLLDHLPPHVRLVISTRADPALPLARLRARGDLVEVRAADLRFTDAEAAAYLSDVAGLHLTPEDIAALETRTEGWVAALQLAALSLRGRADAAGFIAAFAGDDRYIVDYLVEEVLSQQPPSVREFLIQTSILDRMSGPLCDAVTGGTDSQSMLEHLDRANLFLVPLDGTRHWYRYHHLFAEVLATHLLDSRPEEVAELHRRACAWFDAAGEPVAAVRHAVAGGAFERAADLAELAMPALQRDRQEATVAGWLTDLPDAVVRTRPVLALGFIAALMSSGHFDGIEQRLTDLEQIVQGARSDDVADGPPPGVIVVDPEGWSRLPGALRLYRSALALIGEDPAAAIAHADQALDTAAEDDHLTRAGAAAVAGLARWAGGDLHEAHRAYSTSVDGLRRAGHVSDVLGCSITLADLLITQGRLREAEQVYEDALRLAARDPAVRTRGTADMYVGLSGVAYERNDLAAAAQHLGRSRELGDAAGLPQNPYRWRVARARLLAAQGDLAAAVQLLDEAEQVYFGDFAPNVRPVPALRARLQLAQGDLAAAGSWARARELAADDELSYLREFEHITFAMVLLARHRAGGAPTAAHQATQLLERLLDATQEGGRVGSSMDVLVQLSSAHLAQGHHSQAAEALREGLRLAAREAHLRVFLDAGTDLTALLRAVADDTPEGRHAAVVLAAGAEPRQPPQPGTSQPPSPLLDPLSERELDVLRMLGSDLDGPAIARELSVSVNTVRTHTRHIYAKLGVTNRREAVREATRLGLLRQHNR